MNQHEADRIAAAMNQARPDWPTRQLKTLLADDRLKDRPRRDVFVALAWVASEPASANPYRVLEAGPWWRAAGIEGAQTGVTRKVDPANRCGVCSEARERCEAIWAGDHVFDDGRREPVDVPRTVAALKSELTPIAPPPPPRPTLDDLARRPEVVEVAARLRLGGVPVREAESESEGEVA